MPHYKSKCRCGKPIHFPKGVQYGDEWKCYRCGRVNTWVRPGTPGARHAIEAGSKAPPTNSVERQSARSGGGCLVVFIVTAAILLTSALVS